MRYYREMSQWGKLRTCRQGMVANGSIAGQTLATLLPTEMAA
jgi:hypothetical protein